MPDTADAVSGKDFDRFTDNIPLPFPEHWHSASPNHS